MENQAKKCAGAFWFCAAVLAVFAVILSVPASREVFRAQSGAHPFLLGFVKFALLATTGELIAARIGAGRWVLPCKIAVRALIWGLIGLALAFFLIIYSGGVTALIASGAAPGLDGAFGRAFTMSVAMNITFGPVMMAAHRMTDQYLECKAAGRDKTDARTVLNAIDWEGFITFVIFKTIPLFWIPAHTVTFMLPPEYRITMAAALSIVLGAILSIKKARGKTAAG